MNCKKLVFIFLLLILFNVTLAEEETLSAQDQNVTSNDTNVTAINETGVEIDLTANESEVIQEQEKEIEEIIFKNFIPREFKLGDAQFSIQLQNNKNETITNLLALVSGKGFSTYEVAAIESLEPGEKGYILVSGNFKESGLINLTIKIAQKTFYQEVNILGESEEDVKKAENLLKQQEVKKKVLADLSLQLEILKQNYSDMEAELAQKEKEGYDIKDTSLNELKKYIRETQASILGEHTEEARINIGLATEEFNTVESKLKNLEKLPFMKRFKEHLIIFSSIAGAIITFFALYELLKKKGKEAVTTIGSIKPKTESKEEPKVEQQEINKDNEADKSEEEKVTEEKIEKIKPEKKKKEKKKKKHR